LIIQGARVDGHQHDQSQQQGGKDKEGYDLHRRRGSSSSSISGDSVGGAADDGDYDVEAAWPRGIIKTVSVEVVEEVNPDHHHYPGGEGGERQQQQQQQQGGHGGGRKRSEIVGVSADRRASGASLGVEQDWEAMLRAGPPGYGR